VVGGTLQAVLTDDDHLALTIATATYRYPAARERDALEQLGMTPTRFWQRVSWLAEQPHAEAARPAEVRRLRRLAEARRRVRTRPMAPWGT